MAQHRLVDIGQYDTPGAPRAAGECQRQIPSATRDVQHLCTFADVGHHDRVGLPGAVQTG